MADQLGYRQHKKDTNTTLLDKARLLSKTKFFCLSIVCFFFFNGILVGTALIESVVSRSILAYRYLLVDGPNCIGLSGYFLTAFPGRKIQLSGLNSQNKCANGILNAIKSAWAGSTIEYYLVIIAVEYAPW